MDGIPTQTQIASQPMEASQFVAAAEPKFTIGEHFQYFHIKLTVVF
jgi:hypothetical protein